MHAEFPHTHTHTHTHKRPGDDRDEEEEGGGVHYFSNEGGEGAVASAQGD